MTSEFQKGERVLLVAPPEDIQDSGHGVELFQESRPGKVSAVFDDGRYQVRLDEDVADADKFGWITNDYVVGAACLKLIDVPEHELSEVLESIRAAAERQATK